MNAQADDRLCVAFGYAMHGWLQLALISAKAGRSVMVQCSDVYPPFDDLLRWLHQLLDEQLPALWTIDEERGYTSLCAQAIGASNETVELTVFAHDSPNPPAAASGSASEPLLRCRVHRLGLVQEFARRLQRWLAEDYDPAEFGDGPLDQGELLARDDLRRLDLTGLWLHLRRV